MWDMVYNGHILIKSFILCLRFVCLFVYYLFVCLFACLSVRMIGNVCIWYRDGEGVTGTFCALSSVIERLSAELLVDVFQACKRLRAIRPNAVATQVKNGRKQNALSL